jgi:hypothetical protein
LGQPDGASGLLWLWDLPPRKPVDPPHVQAPFGLAQVSSPPTWLPNILSLDPPRFFRSTLYEVRTGFGFATQHGILIMWTDRTRALRRPATRPARQPLGGLGGHKEKWRAPG